MYFFEIDQTFLKDRKLFQNYSDIESFQCNTEVARSVENITENYLAFILPVAYAVELLSDPHSSSRKSDEGATITNCSTSSEEVHVSCFRKISMLVCI